MCISKSGTRTLHWVGTEHPRWSLAAQHPPIWVWKLPLPSHPLVFPCIPHQSAILWLFYGYPPHFTNTYYSYLFICGRNICGWKHPAAFPNNRSPCACQAAPAASQITNRITGVNPILGSPFTNGCSLGLSAKHLACHCLHLQLFSFWAKKIRAKLQVIQTSTVQNSMIHRIHQLGHAFRIVTLLRFPW